MNFNDTKYNVHTFFIASYVVNKFKLQLHHYFQIQTATLRKGMNSFIPQLWFE